MNRSRVPSVAQQLQVAQRRLVQGQIPRGAQYGALAGQPAAMQQQQQQAPAVPQGAEAGAMAGCGPDWGGCASGFVPSPFAGLPYNTQAPYLQPNALLGVVVQPETLSPVTLEISCGNTFFNGCGARTFSPPNTFILTSIVSGFDTRDQLCPGSGIDVAFFDTTDCYCPFDFGCFSNLAPLLLTFDPVDTLSTIPLFNMIIVGDRLEFDGCFPWPPGLIPQPSVIPSAQWVPGFPQPIPGYGPQVAPPMPAPVMSAANGAVNNPFYGSPWGRRQRGMY